MSNFVNPDGSGLVGGLLPTSIGQSLQLDASGNLKTTGSSGGAPTTNANPMPVQDIEQPGYVAASAPPASTNAGSDTPYTFSSQVSRVILQNNTAANLNYAFDVAASAGSLLLKPGGTLIYPKKVTVLHLFTAAAQNINGTAAGNIVVLGAN